MISVQYQDTNCKICNVLLSKKSKTITDQILVENDYYFAISSIGGFVPGWTLIFPKSHKLNLADDYSNKDFLSFTSYVNDVVSSEYGQCVIFEHGANSNGSDTSCGVNHAHLHIVPFDRNLELLALQEAPKFIWKQTDITGVSNIVNGEEYLFCANSYDLDNTRGVISKLVIPQSQFFRKILAKAIGLNNLYDYKRYKFEDISINTSENLSKKFLARMPSKPYV